MWFWVSASFLSGVWSIILGMFLASSYTSNTETLDPGYYYAAAAQRAAQVLKKAQ
jgi:purine-cytosine permease-like protein